LVGKSPKSKLFVKQQKSSHMICVTGSEILVLKY
jgi:hypothetical protein